MVAPLLGELSQDIDERKCLEWPGMRFPLLLWLYAGRSRAEVVGTTFRDLTRVGDGLTVPQERPFLTRGAAMRRRYFLRLAAGAGAALAYPHRAFASLGASESRGCLTVAAGGEFPTVQAAVDAVAPGGTIVVRPGVYRGQVIVPAAKSDVRLIGLGHRPSDVVIADDRANGTPKPDGSGTWGTTGSASVTIDGPGFTVSNLTFANLFDEAAHPEITSQQAVAVLTRADRVAFRQVRFVANQDTLYVNSSAVSVIARAYFRDCYVEGDVDFIFGRGTAVFDRCRIHSLDRASTPAGYATAPSTDITNPHGYLFTRCAFTSDAPPGSVFLGRPWHPSNDPNAIGQTVIRQSALGAHIGPVAWSDFGVWPWEDARFFEYRNYGPGALITPDRPQLTSVEARSYTAAAFLGDWRPGLS
jgi:pectinesterase